MKATDYFLNENKDKIYYIITPIQWNYCNWGNGYGVLQNKKYKKGTWEFVPKNLIKVDTFFDNSYPYNYAPFFATPDDLKFKTFEEAKVYAEKLVEKGVLPNVEIIDGIKRCHLDDRNKYICVIQRPLEHIIGKEFYKYIFNKNIEDIEIPDFKVWQKVYRKNDWGDEVETTITDIIFNEETKEYEYESDENGYLGAVPSRYFYTK